MVGGKSVPLWIMSNMSAASLLPVKFLRAIVHFLFLCDTGADMFEQDRKWLHFIRLVENLTSSLLLPYIPSEKCPKEVDCDDDGRVSQGHPSTIPDARRDRTYRWGIFHSDMHT